MSSGVESSVEINRLSGLIFISTVPVYWLFLVFLVCVFELANSWKVAEILGPRHRLVSIYANAEHVGDICFVFRLGARNTLPVSPLGDLSS